MNQYLIKRTITADGLKRKRKTLGLTQREFAELLGVSKPTVERWETSDKPITGPVVQLLDFLTEDYLEKMSVPTKTLSIRMWYMHNEDVCTLIDIDERTRKVNIKNYTENNQFKAFGVNNTPSFEDYEEFLKSRCFPESRDKIKLILKDLNLPFYDPFLIIKRTEGRMAEDNFWLKVE